MTEPVNGNSNLLNGSFEFAHSDGELTQDELQLLRGLFAQRSDKKVARALAVSNALDTDSGLLTAYLGNELGLLREGLNLVIHQERNRANRLRNYHGDEQAAPAAVSQEQVKAKKKDWGIKLMDATSLLMIGLAILAAALLFAVYSWYAEHRRFTRLNRAATRRRAVSKFGRTASKVRKEQGRR